MTPFSIVTRLRDKECTLLLKHGCTSTLFIGQGRVYVTPVKTTQCGGENILVRSKQSAHSDQSIKASAAWVSAQIACIKKKLSYCYQGIFHRCLRRPMHHSQLRIEPATDLFKKAILQVKCQCVFREKLGYRQCNVTIGCFQILPLNTRPIRTIFTGKI